MFCARLHRTSIPAQPSSWGAYDRPLVGDDRILDLEHIDVASLHVPTITTTMFMLILAYFELVFDRDTCRLARAEKTNSAGFPISLTVALGNAGHPDFRNVVDLKYAAMEVCSNSLA